ncbi:MAG: SDR family oxidoreductase [bacterium]|nr:SDR family oxidoreductase [bacterium]
MNNGLLKDKVALVLGIANERSIGSAIAQAFAREGARVIAAVQTPELVDRVKKSHPFLEALWSCDVSISDQIEALASNLALTVGKVNIVVHSLAFAQRESLKMPLHEISAEVLLEALNISAVSFPVLTGELLRQGVLSEGCVLETLTYAGGERYVPGYAPMGICKAALNASVWTMANELGPLIGARVYGIAAGPISTMSARAVPNFPALLKMFPSLCALRQELKPEHVANVTVMLASYLSEGMTGNIIDADMGLSTRLVSDSSQAAEAKSSE